MKSTVVYYSATGQTKKVAEAIAGALPGEVAVAEVTEAPCLDAS
jgi:flavodoxin